MPIYKNGQRYDGSVAGASETYVDGVAQTTLTEAKTYSDELLIPHTDNTDIHYSAKERDIFNTGFGQDGINATFINQLFSMFTNKTDEYIPVISDTSITLDSLDFGMYRVNTRSMRQALGIPDSNYSSGPPSAPELYIAPGGILAILDFGSLTRYVSVTNGGTSVVGYTGATKPCRLAVFLDTWGTLFYNVRSVYQMLAQQTQTFKYEWSGFKLLTSENYSTRPQRGVLEIPTEVTATDTQPLIVRNLLAQFIEPWTAGYIIGPACATLTVSAAFKGAPGTLGTRASGSTPHMICKPLSTKPITFPAGQYYYELYTTTKATQVT